MSDRPSVAILGASGFIGSRLVEWLVLRDRAEPRPIVRSFKGMARLARFDLDCRVADATDQTALKEQLKGCEALFHCVLGDGETIRKSAEAAYKAAVDAGVRRMVYLSTAMVHGMDPAPGTHDDSELVTWQPFEYNLSKVRAEHLLRRHRADGAVEIVTLRPAIVFGPRSQWWSAQIASDLLNGTAYLIDGGEGICNTVYVDNLIEAMWQGATVDEAANQDFIITDGERVTWRDLYLAVAQAVGVDLAGVPAIPSGSDILKDLARVVRRNRVRRKIVRNRFARAVRQALPARVVDAIKQQWNHEPRVDSSWAGHTTRPLPRLDPEIVSLQQCRYVLPVSKARKLLRYEPQVRFSEGCRRTGEWLRFAFGMHKPARQAESSDCTNSCVGRGER